MEESGVTIINPIISCTIETVSGETFTYEMEYITGTGEYVITDPEKADELDRILQEWSSGHTFTSTEI